MRSPGSKTWEREVRDPAKLAAEPTVEARHGKARASYQVAPLPGGGWAWRCDYWRIYGQSGGATPWRTTETRAEAVAAAKVLIFQRLTRAAADPDFADAQSLAVSFDPAQQELF